MTRVLRIAWREYVESVRTKMFLVSVLLTPVLIGVIWFVAGKANKPPAPAPASSPVAVFDATGELGEDIAAQFEQYNAAHAGRKLQLDMLSWDQSKDAAAGVRGGRYSVYAAIDADVLEGGGHIRISIYQPAFTASNTPGIVQNLLQQAVVSRRTRLHNVPPEMIAAITRPVPVEYSELSAAKGSRGGEAVIVLQHMVPFFFMFMVYMGIFGFGQSMLTSLLEEKSSRVIEVLLACVSPLELMAGKIIGLAGMGLTVMIAWTACAGVAVQMRGLPVSVAPGMLAYMLVYYVLGFTLLSSLLAAIGSVCNTLKEAQGLMMPVTILFIIPMAGWFGLASHPNGLAARVMSFIPPLAPIVMILRLATPQAPGLLEVAGSIVWLAAATAGTVWLASKVFRTGVLMYGKRPGLREILRWVGQS